MNLTTFYTLGLKTFEVMQLQAINVEKPSPGKVSYFTKLAKGHYEDFEFPVIFRQYPGSNSNFYDLLNTGSLQLLLVSDRMVDCLKTENLSGWKTFPVKLFGKDKMEITGYHGFSVLGKCGPVDYSKSEIVEMQGSLDLYIAKSVSDPEPVPFEKYYKGLHIGLDKWDGSDFFFSEGYKSIMVTEKAASALTKHKITNFETKNLADWVGKLL